MSEINIQFLGASETVTGSKYAVNHKAYSLLIDCGMFQGVKELRELNWENLPINVPALNAILLTHGHLDHVGYLPRLIKQGFKGKIIGTAPTLAIAEIILLDSAKIHEEDAERANKEGYSKHHPAKPFYTRKEAEEAVKYFESSERNIWFELNDDIKFRFKYNSHIIGATFIELEIGEKRLVFSGDIGRKDDLLLYAPEKPVRADYLFMESTYGDRLHPNEDVSKLLIELIQKTVKNKGTLIIPSFAVERLQTLMYILFELNKSQKIPNIPIFVDSPMGNNVLSVFESFTEWHKLSLSNFITMSNSMNIVSSYKETWDTIDDPRPKVVIAGSGMVTGGRVLTYLKQLIDEPNTSVLMVGFQAEGTRGRKLLEGAKEVKLYGKYYPVKGTIHHIESLSAHADQAELLDWCSDLKIKPKSVFLVHGEPTASAAFKKKLENVFGWNVSIPKLYDQITIKDD